MFILHITQLILTEYFILDVTYINTSKQKGHFSWATTRDWILFANIIFTSLSVIKKNSDFITGLQILSFIFLCQNLMRANEFWICADEIWQMRKYQRVLQEKFNMFSAEKV